MKLPSQLQIQRMVIVLLLVLVAYAASYLLVRTLHVRRSPTGSYSVVIPQKSRLLFTIYAPLAWLDHRWTRMDFQWTP